MFLTTYFFYDVTLFFPFRSRGKMMEMNFVSLLNVVALSAAAMLLHPGAKKRSQFLQW
jgi:hypothetical protein